MIQTFLKKLKVVARAILPPSSIDFLRLVKNAIATSLYRTHVVTHRYGNGVLRVCIADSLAEGWYDFDWPPLPEIEVLQERYKNKKALIFDLGAHQAVVALMLARDVGDLSQLVAVEACPHNVKVARKNCSLNSSQNAEILHAAVSDTSGSLLFNRSFNGQIDDASRRFGSFEVEAVTIDQLTERYGSPDVLFIDIEGAEHLALAGAKKTLESNLDCFIEVHVGYGLEKLGGSIEKILSYFPENCYELLVRSEEMDSFRPLRAKDELFEDRFFLLALSRSL